MDSYSRLLDLPGILARKSCFLFGPRQVGKSWLIRHTLRHARVYSLLDNATYVELGRHPERIEQEWLADPRDNLVVIDEVQRLPLLLNEAHRLIEQHGIRFLLTGSSARKLRRGGTNLLGGRARVHHLHPFVSAELGREFNLERAVNRGLLPPHYIGPRYGRERPNLAVRWKRSSTMSFAPILITGMRARSPIGGRPVGSRWILW